VFLGGGTPSLLPAPLLRRLLDGLDALTDFRGAALEVTAECNPESLDLDQARTLLDLGVERLSIGFQSLHDDVLGLLGRVHSAEDSFRAYEAARRAGARDVNLDVIFALPGQEAAVWRADLARILDLGPDHVAAYNLAFEEGTPFARWLESGRLRRPTEERELELFWLTRELLQGAGLDPYEISNFASSGYQSLHNINYWENGPYVGLGPSAVSGWGGERRGNVRSVGEYVRRMEAGRDPAAWRETLAVLDRLGETWWLGLRTTRGVDPVAARTTAGLGPGAVDPALDVAGRLCDQGLLEHAGGRVRLTARGLPVADAVAREFLGLARDQEAPRG
jgi:oxygen-independent coproporphyrinogen-3 oxidase